MIRKTFNHFGFCCGLGGGAKGFNMARSQVGNMEATRSHGLTTRLHPAYASLVAETTAHGFSSPVTQGAQAPRSLYRGFFVRNACVRPLNGRAGRGGLRPCRLLVSGLLTPLGSARPSSRGVAEIQTATQGGRHGC